MTRIPLILSLLALLPASALAQNTWYVPDDFPTIQAGINGATNGDTVIVRDGDYFESITFNESKHITLKSENGPEFTLIDNDTGDIVVNFIDIGTTSIIDGFTIGWTSSTGVDVSHGGSPTIRNCIIEECDDGGFDINGSPVIENCIIRNCSSNFGGGIEIHGGWPPATITNCTIESCFANFIDGYGGGICLRSDAKAIITDCTIKDCSAYYDGGGLYGDPNCDIYLDNCTFTNNGAGRNGGGMGYSASSPVLDNCTFTGNGADDGGGMWCNYSSPTLDNCTFMDNAADEGGGMFFDNSSPALEGCVFSGNEGQWGGALRLDYTQAVLTNCTITSNSAFSDGGGIHYAYDSHLELNNCIVWGNSASTGTNILDDANSTNTEEVTYSCVGGGFSGTGNIDADPLFVDSDNGDFHLQATSPCIDTGDPNSPPDPDGTRADMGVFYFNQDDDMDDDGLLDADEIAIHGTNPDAFDTDGDGLGDGQELGMTNATVTAYTDLSIFKEDHDPSTMTDPLNADSDGGGINDGHEDQDKNGAFSTWETDPNDSIDDDLAMYVYKLNPGNSLTLRVRNGTPNALVVPCYSVRGTGPTDVGIGVFLDLTQPIVDMTPFRLGSGGYGEVVAGRVPPWAPLDLPVYFQGVEITFQSGQSIRLTNSITKPITAN